MISLDIDEYPTYYSVQKSFPAYIICRVCDGWKLFLTVDSYKTWKKQK